MRKHGGRSQAQDIVTWTLLVILLVGAAALGLSAFFGGSDTRRTERDLLSRLSNQRPGRGRLFLSSSYVPNTLIDGPDLGKAQLYALTDSPGKQRIQSLIYLARNEWQKAADTLKVLSVQDPRNPEILNDLGVAYMALAIEDPLNYFRALPLFDLAIGISPNAPAPRFNALLIYEAIGLLDLESQARTDYQRVERDTNWIAESHPPAAPSETEAINKLHVALGNQVQAENIFDAHPEVYRRAATEYALNPSDSEGNDPVVAFIMDQLNRKYHDSTIKFILAPLRTSNRDRIIRSRQLVRAGTLAYLDSKPRESLKLYDEAAAAIVGVDSTFDHLWVDLNRADAENRMGNLTATRILLNNVIEVSRRENLRWVLGLALASKGSSLRLATSYVEHLDTLSESEQILSGIGASRDSGRPLYYAATALFVASSVEDSLRLTFRALNVTPREDHLRLTQLFWLAGSLLYRLGYPSYGISFAEMSVREANKTTNLAVQGTAASYLASMYEATLQYNQAEKYLSLTKQVTDRINEPTERKQVRFSLNVVCGRIYLRRGDLDEARKCLQENLAIFASEPNPLRFYLSQSLLLLAKTHITSGRLNDAREEFRDAIEVVESDDTYIATEKLRLLFENERRDLYDSAINFEYDHGGVETAWNYTQRYRSKLFLEFLGQTNPTLREIRSEAIDRDKVQKLISPDLQVVEYVMLNDRLLIWLVSDKIFTSRSIPITRATLEQRVTDFVAGIRDQKDIRKPSEDLYQILIAPIENLLDPSRAVAIVPDQALHRLPFAALHSAYSSSYLVERYTILESPNLTHLLAAGSTTPQRSSVVSFGAKTDDISSARELSDIGNIYTDAQTFSGEAADKSRFLASMRTASVFHYAGHSEDASDPLRSSILLDGSREGPNSVTAVDISGQRMRPNSIVILASCDSSVGNSRDGIGMRGLTSAFLISGAGSVVGSLWPVETTSTSELVIRFHEAFAMTRIPVAQALRQAQLSFLKTSTERSHPYYWSGFVVTGNSSALR